MKKANIILFIFLVIVVLSSTIYFSAFYGHDHYDFTLYKKIYGDIVNCEKFDDMTSENEITISATKSKTSDDKSYSVSVIFENPRFLMKDINVLVVDQNPIEDIIYPSLGLIDDKSYDLVPNATNEDNQKDGISLVMRSEKDVDNLLIYFSYIKNDERIEHYYKVKVESKNNNA